MIRFPCPHCRRNLSVGDHLAGRVGACPSCKKKIQIPRPEPEAEELEELEELPEEEERVTAAPAKKSPPARQKRRPADEDEDDRRVPARKPPRRRDQDEDEEEEDDRPAARRRSRRDEEEDEDDRPRRRPGGKKKKKRRREESRGLALPPFAIGLIVVGVIALLFAGLMVIKPELAIAPIILGVAIAVVGSIWFAVVAFMDSPLQLVLCWFVPFYSLFYLVTHWEETQKPFFTSLLGSVFVMIGACAGGFGAGVRAGMDADRRGAAPLPENRPLICHVAGPAFGVPPIGRAA